MGHLSKRVLEISYYGIWAVLSALGERLKKQGFALDWSRDNPMILFLTKSYLKGGKARETHTIIGKEASGSQ